MDNDKNSKILRSLEEQNPWWESGNADDYDLPSFKRKEYQEVHDAFFSDIRRFPVLSGPRRVGKSTIMLQLIDELLASGKAKPSQILFYTLDDFPNVVASIEDVLNVYREAIYPDYDFYLFLDEAQKDPYWKNSLKRLYDLHKKARAIICGSSSVELEKQSDESGAGRFLTIKIPTMSFYDFCELNDEKKDIQSIDVFKMHELSLPEQTSIYMKLSSLSRQYFRYLKLGGFPEYARSEQYGEVSRLIRDQIITKAISQDIVESYSLRDPSALINLYSYLCYHSSDIISIEALTQALEIDKATCNQYLLALENANLIYVSEQMNLSGKSLLRKRRKIYVSDYALRCAVTRNNDVETNPRELGYAIETVSFKHTKDYFSSVDEWLYNVGYVRGSLDKEIDIVVQKRGIDFQYVEAKYRNNSRIKDADGTVIMGLEDTPGYLITKDPTDYGLQDRGKTKLYRIPAFAYAYLLGKMMGKGF